ncbi:MAG: retropepsin-like aspartic protease [Crocinitomicaceae bacterium]
MKKTVFFLVLVILLSSCKSHKVINIISKSKTSQVNFNREIDFDYVEKHIFIEVEINGKVYNFLFDTGWEITSIDESLKAEMGFKKSTSITGSGSSFESYEMDLGTIPNLTLDSVLFESVGIVVHNMNQINEYYACYERIDGILGTNILQNANWQIDYEAKKIRFSDDIINLKIGDNATVINVTPRIRSKLGVKRVKATFDSQNINFIFDTGSSGGFSGNPALLDSFSNSKVVRVMKRSAATENDSYINSIVFIKSAFLDSFEVKNTQLSLEKGVSQLVGNDFFEHFIVTIDWSENKFYLKPVSEIQIENRIYHGFTFKPNYKTNSIAVSGMATENMIDVKLGSQLISINGIDLTNLSKTEFCNFWNNSWQNIIKMDEVLIEIQGGEQPILLK